MEEQKNVCMYVSYFFNIFYIPNVGPHSQRQTCDNYCGCLQVPPIDILGINSGAIQ